MNRLLVIALLLALTVSSRGAEPLPSAAEIKKLTNQSLLGFNSAVQKADFTDFYKSTAKLWQEQTTPDKLKEIFQSFVDRKFDMEEVIKKQAPTLEPAPALDADGFLVVNGIYNLESASLTFQLKYNSEGGAWKLVGINIHSGAAPRKRQEVPSEAELKK